MVTIAFCVAYALGCIPPGWMLVRRKAGIDLRATGSGATGATNAARVLGNGAFAVVMLLDAAKAALALACARWIAPANDWNVLALPCVVAGHIWPAPLGFRGGRGAAPLLGGCIALSPWFAAAAAIPAALGAMFTRRIFVLTAAAAAGGTASAWWLLRTPSERVAFAVAFGLVLLAHRSHFMRLLRRPVP